MTDPRLPMKAEWVGIVIGYPDGTAVAVQMNGDDIITVPDISPLVDEREMETFAELLSWRPRLGGVRLAFETRRLTAWYVGEAYAKARHRGAEEPREISS